MFHKELQDYFNHLAQTNALSHAYLCVGPDEIGKKIFFLKFIQAQFCLGDQAQSNSLFGGTESTSIEKPCFNCSHCKQITSGSFQDFSILKREDGKHRLPVSAIRDLLAQAYRSASTGDKKYFLIDEAHLMTLEASNALLKTLEEPPESCILILLTSYPDLLPETIQSRCQVIEFTKQTTSIENLDQSTWDLAQKLPGKYQRFSDDPELIHRYNEQIQSSIDFLLSSTGVRLKTIESWFKKKDKHVDQKQFWKEQLHIWQTLLRDSIMLQLNYQNVLHKSAQKDLIQLSARYNQATLLSSLDLLRTIQQSLNKSFNLRLQLEEFAVNLT